MTPQRQAYLAKCSKRELYLRNEITRIKYNIKHRKNALNVGDVLSKILSLNDDDHFYGLRYNKIDLTTYRHELAKLKGMDNVVVPTNVDKDCFWQAQEGDCCCGNHVIRADNVYCNRCGRRILWEKVK